MPKFELVKAGDELWDVHRADTMRHEMGSWRVYVKEVNLAEGWVLASWNGNTPRKFYRASVQKWRRTPYRKAEDRGKEQG